MENFIKDLIKKDFKFDQAVKVINTGTDLDGIEGRISGISSVNWFDTYIVSLANPMTADANVMPTFTTFVISEINLEII